MIEGEAAIAVYDEQQNVEWAKQQVGQALRLYQIHAPVRNLDRVTTGSVLIERSGGLRLVLSIEEEDRERVVVLLGKEADGQINVSRSPLKRISALSLSSIIARREGDPLVNFREHLQGILANQVLLHNVLYLCNSNSGFDKAMVGIEINNYGYGELLLYLERATGRITGATRRLTFTRQSRASLICNVQALPQYEFISTLVLDKDLSSQVRSTMILTVVITNALRNVENLLVMADMAGIGL